MFRPALPNGRELRLLEESDAHELYALVEANRDYLARWLPWAEHQTLEATRAFIRLTRLQHANNNGFQAALLEDQRIIGCAGFHKVDWSHRSTTIGYWLAGPYQGKGTMTLAVSALVDWAFRSWQLHRVEIQAAVENHRSRAIPLRLGFREEGTLREVERVGGRYLDHVVYSMLAQEWGASAGAPDSGNDDRGPLEAASS